MSGIVQALTDSPWILSEVGSIERTKIQANVVQSVEISGAAFQVAFIMPFLGSMFYPGKVINQTLTRVREYIPTLHFTIYSDERPIGIGLVSARITTFFQRPPWYMEFINRSLRGKP
jgi:hypothetical protein